MEPDADNDQSASVANQLDALTATVNATRYLAWRRILLAFVAVLTASAIFVATQSVVWTGGLLVAAIWVFNSIRQLLAANRVANQLQNQTGMNFLMPLPVWLKIGNVLVIPLATTFALLTTISIFAPATLSTGTQVEVVGMYDPSDAEASAANLAYYSGVEVNVTGGSCQELVVDSSVVVGDTDELILTFSNSRYGVGEGNHRFVIGTNDIATEQGDTIVVDDAYCV